MITYHILRTENGHTEAYKAKYTSPNRLKMTVRVSFSDLGIPEMEIGAKVLALLDGQRIECEPYIEQLCDGQQKEWNQIRINLEPIAPPEPTGKQVLEALPVGSRWIHAGAQFMRTVNGIFWFADPVSDPYWAFDIGMWWSCAWVTNLTKDRLTAWAPGE